MLARLISLSFIFLVISHAHAADADADARIRALSEEFDKVQNHSGARMDKAATRIWKTAIQGMLESNLDYLRGDMKTRGMVIYAGIYGPVGDRSVRMLFFADFSKWNKEDIVGGMDDIKGWYNNYNASSGFAHAVAARLGGVGSIHGNMQVLVQEKTDVSVAVVLQPSGKPALHNFRQEVGWAEYAFY